MKHLQISFSFEKPTHSSIIEEWSRLKIVSMHQSTSTSLQVNFFLLLFFVFVFFISGHQVQQGSLHAWINWLVTCMNEAGCQCAPGIVTCMNEAGWLHAWMKLAAGVHQVQRESLYAWIKLAGYMYKLRWLVTCMNLAGYMYKLRWLVTCMN